ncbi:inhibitor of KinA [Lewinella aquimaris]|uniref:Inhibitor of KinA n=1 Tax=Neolewinella aquimaris TaxID=1835722 RepID=A0A840EC01_9BACT|nr:5-oxoprolinase subunit PxpB [Neolewinella aquimaris]MBB4081035.1 inhibitor of KinA [Neolewinella aquimaris]
MRRPRRIHPYGPEALLLEWEQRIDPKINCGVHAYASAIGTLPGILECVPAYASLLVTFRPAVVSAYDLCERIIDLPVANRPDRGVISHQVPVCYDPALAPDLSYVANQQNLTTDEVVQFHTGQTYQVYLIGFRPGFAFMGEVHPAIQVARRRSPRTAVPAGAVGLAGGQTGIYPDESPGGWQLIGRCPLPLLSTRGGETRFRAGDRVSFYPIATRDYEHLVESPPPWPRR